MGFGDVLLKTKSVLESSSSLSAFAQEKWRKSPSVRLTWRNRNEISSSDLPLIMITRPSTQRGRNYGSVTSKARIRIYAGFYQPDEDKRQIELVEFEEKILAVLEESQELRDLIDGMTPADGANDEGALGDCCFSVQEIEVDTKGLT